MQEFIYLGPTTSENVVEPRAVYLLVLDGVQGETLWGGESRARNHTHKRERKAGQAAVERTTNSQSVSL